MVSKEFQLMTFTRGEVTGKQIARFEADAEADFGLRRGFRLGANAEAQVTTELKAALGSQATPWASAAIDAGIGVSSRLAMATQLDVHGLFAEACAAAEARVKVRLRGTMTGQVVFDTLDVRWPPGVSGPLRAFLNQVQINASAYAEAYFALRARGRMVATGTIVPTGSDVRAAGFTVDFSYGYAYIWGAGFSGEVNFDLPDVPQIVGVVADAAISELLRLLPSDIPAQLRSLLQLALPLAASSAIAVGQALGPPQDREGETPVQPGDVAAAFLTTLRTAGLELVLRYVIEAGVEQATAVLDRALDDLTSTDNFRTKATSALARSRQILTEVGETDSLTEALTAAIKVCETLTAYLTDAAGSPGTDPDGLFDTVEALTLAGAAAGSLSAALGQDPTATFPPTMAARIRRDLNLDPNAHLNVVHLVTYVGIHLADLDPVLLTGVNWVAGVMGSPVETLVRQLWDLGQDPGTANADRALAQQVIAGVNEALEDLLRPYVDGLPPEAAELKAVAEFISPLLDVLEVALPPLLAGPAGPSPEEARRARDEVDALLVGMFGAMVADAMETIIKPLFAEGATELNALADRVKDGGPEVAEFFAVANEASVLFRITPVIVIESLRETARLLPIARDTAFQSALDVLRSYILLPAPQERRTYLQALAGSDQPPGGDAALVEDLLGAMFGKSSRFAIEMIGPSLKMSSLIALEQGPVALATIVQDGQILGAAIGENIIDLLDTSKTVVEIATSLATRGRVTADQLVALGDSLKVLIGSSTDIAQAILQLVKDLSWPVFVASTGGLGLLLRDQFDQFFEGASWLLDEIQSRLNVLTEHLVEAMIATAQDVGVLDTGEGEDLGSLGRAVRQRTLGGADEPGLELFGGAVGVSHAKLATMTADAALGDEEVRVAVRKMHQAAVLQARTARQKAMVNSYTKTLAEERAALEAQLRARQRPTGSPMSVEITGIALEQINQSGTEFDVVISGAGIEFITGPHPLVKIEVGGWPAPIDPEAWWIDAEHKLRGQFLVVGDPALAAPHPFIAEGAVNIPPRTASIRAAADDREVGRLTQAVRDVLRHQAAAPAHDPARFLTSPIDSSPQPSPAAALTTDTFLPPVLRPNGAHTVGDRFPAVLALDRTAMIQSAQDAGMAEALKALPGTPARAFISSADLANLGGQGGGDPQWVSASALARSVAGAGNRSTRSRLPIRVTTLSRPGGVVVTVSVTAVPMEGQDASTTPHASLPAPIHFFLVGEEPHEEAAAVERTAVPQTMPEGSTLPVGLTFVNTGDTTWTPAEYSLRLAPQGTDVWGVRQLPLTTDVDRGGDVAFDFTVPAPPRNVEALLQWQMCRDRPNGVRRWIDFPSSPHIITQVSGDVARFAPPLAPASLPVGGSGTVTLQVTNVGTTTWTPDAGYKLVRAGAPAGGPEHPITTAVEPQGEVRLSVVVPAPAPPGAAFRWQLMRADRGLLVDAASPEVFIQVDQPPPVIVPNVVGADWLDAKTAIEDAGLRSSFRGASGLDTVVSLQDPAGGRVVNRGSLVSCTLRRDPPPRQ